MKRFFVWSALSALVGLILAAVAYCAYWTLHGRLQPATVGRHQAEVWRLLEDAAWVSAGPLAEQPVYLVGPRSPELERIEREAASRMRAAGRELRIVVVAGPGAGPAERATIAELWLTREFELYRRWSTTPAANWTAAGLVAADGDPARTAIVEASAALLATLRRRLAGSGLQPDPPLVLWRDEAGRLRACACRDPRSWERVSRELGLAEPPASAAIPSEPAPARKPSLSYPVLPPAAPAAPRQDPPGGAPPTRAPSPTPEARPAPATGPARAAPPPSGGVLRPGEGSAVTKRPAARSTAPESPRRASPPPPEARRSDDTLFY